MKNIFHLIFGCWMGYSLDYLANLIKQDQLKCFNKQEEFKELLKIDTNNRKGIFPYE